MADKGPTLRRRELGAALRDLRQHKGLTIEDVAEELLCSPTKISRIETAQRAASLRDVRDLCRIYGVDDDRTTQLMRLTRESRQRGWWQEYGDISTQYLEYPTFIGLEAAAANIRTFETSFIPGLLQTEHYARAVVGGNAFPEPDETIIDDRVSVRLRRQQRLTEENPLSLWAIVDESAIRRVIGSAEIMQEQLRRLIEMSRLRNVILQIIPLSVGVYPGLDSSGFHIIQFTEDLPDVVYTEGMIGSLFAEKEVDVKRSSSIFDRMRAEALNPNETRELMARAVDTFS